MWPFVPLFLQSHSGWLKVRIQSHGTCVRHPVFREILTEFPFNRWISRTTNVSDEKYNATHPRHIYKMMSVNICSVYGGDTYLWGSYFEWDLNKCYVGMSRFFKAFRVIDISDESPFRYVHTFRIWATFCVRCCEFELGKLHINRLFQSEIWQLKQIGEHRNCVIWTRTK